MEYLELSIKNVKEKSIELANKMPNNFDVVIFVAKGSFQIGKEISEYYNIPLLEIFAQRKVGKLKEVLKIFLKVIPNSIKKKLREKEINMNIHEKNTDREISFEKEIWKNYKQVENILIVDDSVDTGNSMLQVKDAVQNYFKEANITIAALNIFTKSEKNIKTDYYIWKDTMLNGPWSNDSKYNKEFIKKYKEWKKKENERK